MEHLPNRGACFLIENSHVHTLFNYKINIIQQVNVFL